MGKKVQKKAAAKKHRTSTLQFPGNKAKLLYCSSQSCNFVMKQFFSVFAFVRWNKSFCHFSSERRGCEIKKNEDRERDEMKWNEKDSANNREARLAVCFMANGLAICVCNRRSLRKRQLKFLLAVRYCICFRHSADTNLFVFLAVWSVCTRTNSVIVMQPKRWKRKKWLRKVFQRWKRLLDFFLLQISCVGGGVTLSFLD